VVLLAIVLLASAASVAAPPDSGDPAAGRPQGLATAAWKLEAVELADGRRLEGLIVEEDDDGVVFVQVVRRPGKPMFLVSRGRIDGRRIRATSRLPAADHAMLASRVEAFRGQRDAARISELAVSLTQDDETGPWRYAGRWFSLDSTMPAASTREAVVRLEQVLEALATLVPAATSRPAAAPPIAVRLCGTQSEYRREQERLGIRIDNPAFYVPSRRLLVAGSDMPAIVEQEQLAADALSLTERSLADRDREFAASLRSLAADLEREGLPAAKRADLIGLARSRWEREKTEKLAEVMAARRDNAAAVAGVRRSFFAWLAHEAWHAYADAHVGRRLPPWLDEGVAQVIETAPVELGELRLDAPDPERLGALQRLLGEGAAPPLADVITAPATQFHQAHGRGSTASRTAYLMAWGLAFHLALVEPMLTPAALAALESPTADDAGRIAHFEALVGRPLDDFEPAWRQAIQRLRPHGPVTSSAAER
jgi:hypothetical protein